MDAPTPGTLPPALYVNFLRVGPQRSEFFLTFGQLTQEDVGGAHLVASLVTTPAHAKSMLKVLADAVSRYEARLGPIPAASGLSGLSPGEKAPALAPASGKPPRGEKAFA